MKTIHLMRHAKSDWSSSADDHKRPLAKRGRKSARELADFLSSKKIFVDIVISSDSKRTLQTLETIQKKNRLSKDVYILNELYLAEKSDLIEVTKEIDSKNDSVLILGHNPELEEFAYFLLGSSSSIFVKFPTASFLTIQLNVEKWSEVSEGCGRIFQFWIPRKDSL